MGPAPRLKEVGVPAGAAWRVTAWISMIVEGVAMGPAMQVADGRELASGVSAVPHKSEQGVTIRMRM